MSGVMVQVDVGPQAVNAGDGAALNVRGGKTGDVIVSELHPRYFEATYRNNVFSLSVVTAAAVTAYVGAAAGTPQICLYNPVNSGKNAVIISANAANVVAASAAGTVTWGLYFGPTAAITQATTTAPRSMLTLQAAGSVMTGFINAALTSGTAAVGVIPLGYYYWATAAGALATSLSLPEVAGQIIIPPGAYAALGGSAALTSATWIGGLVWSESPV